MRWEPIFVSLLILSTVVDYVAARMIAGTEEPSVKKLYLTISLSMNLSLLFFFKYSAITNPALASTLKLFGLPLELPATFVIPAGISFYTFQTMSYTIDVYRGNLKAEKNMGIFALFVSFFPQLVAGPIERAGDLIPQFRIKKRFTYQNTVEGLRLILWGFFKKVAIANFLGRFVDAAYGQAVLNDGQTMLLATYFFAFQIYTDFSGYSDIAMGSAKILGFNLTRNFDRPYLASSIPEFWQRWHRTLCTWFKDYVYIPLGGNRVPYWRWCINIIIVFAVSGAWHGGKWTFLFWGLLHALFFIVSVQLMKEEWPEMSPWVPRLVTFHLVTISWIFFRANSLTEAVVVLINILTLEFGKLTLQPIFTPWELALAVALIVFMMKVETTPSMEEPERALNQWPTRMRWAAYVGLFMCVALSYLFNISYDSGFIYFNF